MNSRRKRARKIARFLKWRKKMSPAQRARLARVLRRRIAAKKAQ